MLERAIAISRREAEEADEARVALEAGHVMDWPGAGEEAAAAAEAAEAAEEDEVVSEAAEAAAEAEAEWACAVCTLLNSPATRRCVMCDAMRGGSLPAAAVLARQHGHGAAPIRVVHHQPPPAPGGRSGDGGGARARGRSGVGGAQQVGIAGFILRARDHAK